MHRTVPGARWPDISATNVRIRIGVRFFSGRSPNAGFRWLWYRPSSPALVVGRTVRVANHVSA